MQKGSRHGLSDKNPCKLSSRYEEMELIYHCLRYPEWKSKLGYIELARGEQTEWTDDTGRQGISREEMSREVKLIEDVALRVVCEEGKEYLYPYLMKAVTKGTKFNNLRVKEEMDCGRNKFYDLYHKFYYLFSQEKHGL